MLKVAIEAAKAGGAIGLKYFYKQPKVNFKPDNSPVTIADKTAEKDMRRIISRHFPDHGIIGEEFPPINPNSPYQWILDPIDGTRDYIRSLKLWATFVALRKDGEIIAAVANYPTTEELFSAQKGKGAFLNGKRIHVSKTKDLKSAYLTHGQITRFEQKGQMEALMRVARKIDSKRAFGSYGLALLLKGNVDVYMEPGGSIWDFATPQLLIKEAGGKFSDFSGKNKIDSGNATMTNGLLHSKVIALFNKK